MNRAFQTKVLQENHKIQQSVVFKEKKAEYNFCIKTDTNAELNAESFLCAYLHSSFKVKR